MPLFKCLLFLAFMLFLPSSSLSTCIEVFCFLFHHTWLPFEAFAFHHRSSWEKLMTFV
jgi:hypothetical protein